MFTKSWSSLVGFLVLLVLPDLAASKIYQGENLEEPISVKVYPKEGDIVIARASQRRADVAIELYDITTDTLVRVSDIDPYMMLDEFMLVEGKDCSECEVRLVAREFVSQRSPYQLDIDFVGDANIVRNEMEGVRALSTALNLFSQSTILEGADKEVKLSEAISLLQRFSDAPNDKFVFEIWLLSRMVLAEVLHDANLKNEKKDVLLSVLDLTRNYAPAYSVVVMYQLAATFVDQIRTREFYEAGLEASIRFGDPLYVAVGKSYQGVQLVSAGEIAKGERYFTEALAIFSKEKSWHYVLPLLHNLSWAKTRAGDMARALAFATQAKLVAQQFKDEVYILWSLYSMGIAYGELGQYYHASEMFDEAIDRHHKLPIGTKKAAGLLIGYLHQDKARVLMYQGAYDLAWDSISQSIEHYENGGYESSLIDAVFVQGEIATARNQFSIADQRFSQVIAYDRENNRGRYLARHLLKLSELQAKQGSAIDASLSINEAVKLISSTEDFITLGECFSQLVNVLYQLEAYDEALHYAEKFEPFLVKYNSEHDKAIFYYRRALAAYAKGNRLVTKSSLDSALDIVDAALPKLVRKDLIRSYLALQKSLFELNLELYLDMNPDKLRGAISIVEQHRARTLKDSVMRLKFSESLSSRQKAARALILEEIQESAAAWYKKRTFEDSQLLEKARALSARMGNFEAQVLLAREDFTYDNRETQELNWQGRPKETILYYFVGREKTWLWVINEREVLLRYLPGHAELQMLTATVLDHISMHPAKRKNKSAWELDESIAKVSRKLLPNILGDKETDLGSLMVVIPDGPLHGFPFGVLYTREAGQSYLVDEWSIEYAPSLHTRALLSAASEEPIELFESAFVVTNPEFKGDLADLDHSANEAALLKEHLGKKVIEVEGVGAKKNTVLEHLKSSPSILHIATHGLVNSHEPALSGLLFSGERGNQMWLAPEIRTSSINADLVVLSACESASGRYIAGEGLMSLSRAFFEAGVSRVIGTLWKVDDEASAELSSAFYRNLLGDKMKASKALQQAQRKVRDSENVDWTDPYYWAAFQYQGAPNGTR